MTTTLPDLLKANAALNAAGFAGVRIPPGEKRLKGKEAVGWNARTAADAEFAAGDNIGVQSGPISDGGTADCCLMTVDLDAMTAVEMAPQFLPPTAMRDGRTGKPDSHWHYLVPLATVPAESLAPAGKAHAANLDHGRHPGPRTLRLRHPVLGVLLELRGTGAQTVCPPSVWTSEDGTRTERREWAGGVRGEPARVEYSVLLAAVMKLAEACGWTPPAARPKAERPRKPGATGNARKADPALPHTTDVHLGGQPPADWLALYRQAETGDGDVVIDGATYAGDELERRAGLWLAAVPDADLSRVGHDGDGRYLMHFSVVAHGFLVRQPARLHRLADRYDARLAALRAANPGGGYDPWAAGEREHKFDAARRPPPPDDPHTRPAGHKLTDRADDPPRAWDDAARLAAEFAADTPVWFWSGRPAVYAGDRYRLAPADDFAADVRAFCERQAAAEFRRRDAAGRSLAEATSRQFDADAAALDGRQSAAAALADKARDAELKDIAKQRAKLAKDRAKNDAAGRGTAPTVTAAAVAGTVQSIRGRRRLPGETAPGTWIDGPDRGPVLPVRNGLIDLTTRELHPHTPDCFALTRLPVAYAPDGRCPRWEACLATLMDGDGERVAVLQELLGAVLDVAYPSKHFGLLVGESDCGKTSYLAGLLAVIGPENAAAVSLDLLAAKEFAVGGLLGKLADVVSEQPRFDSEDEAVLKGLTGGDLCRFPGKYEPDVFAVNTCKILVACNTAPRFADRTSAIWNRCVAVPFRHVIPKAEQDPAMKTPAHWGAESAGILNWALAGLDRLRSRRGFTRSAQCELLKAELYGQSNPMAVFLGEYARPADGVFTPTEDILNRVEDHYRRQRIRRAVDPETLAAAVRRTYPAVVKGRGRKDKNSPRVNGYHGLTLAPESGWPGCPVDGQTSAGHPGEQ